MDHGATHTDVPLGIPFRRMLDALPSGLLACDFDGYVLYLNPAAAAALRIQPDALLHQRLASRYPGLADGIARSARDGRSVQLRMQLDDERSVNVGLRAGPWSDGEGGPEGHIVVLRDLRSILIRRRESRTETLLAGADVMTASAAHELRNPGGSDHRLSAQ